MRVVIDTNILVSALWSRNGAPAQILAMLLHGQLTPCCDWRILTEYREVLCRPKFRFSTAEVNAIIDWIKTTGVSVVAVPIDTPFIDESDKKFYEVAKTCHAILISGNLKHYPNDPDVCSVQDFLSKRHPSELHKDTTPYR